MLQRRTVRGKMTFDMSIPCKDFLGCCKYQLDMAPNQVRYPLDRSSQLGSCHIQPADQGYLGSHSLASSNIYKDISQNKLKCIQLAIQSYWHSK